MSTPTPTTRRRLRLRLDRLLQQRTSFVTETVFSHPSKVELVRASQETGYRVILHVVVVPEDVAALRVAHRVRRGGHAVPEEKTRERYRRLWPLVAQARQLADQTFVYDNGSATEPYRLMASYERGARAR